jgi:hypothetical protein
MFRVSTHPYLVCLPLAPLLKFNCRSEEHKPSITILKLKLPSMKSMAVWKEECADLTSETGEGRHYESARILSFNIFESSEWTRLRLISDEVMSCLSTC